MTTDNKELLDQLKLNREEVKNATYYAMEAHLKVSRQEDQLKLVRSDIEAVHEEVKSSEKKILAHIEQVRFDLQRYTGEASDSLIQTLEVMFPEKSFPKKTDVKIPIVN